jgi:hypothetical protein
MKSPHARGRARQKRVPPSTRLAALGLAATFSLACSAQEARDNVCRVVSGSLTAVCQGDVCSSGSLSGDLKGKFTTRMTSIYPGGSGWIYTGWTKVELDGQQGGIETLNYAMTPFNDKGGPDLSRSTEVLTLTEATGAWEEYSGAIVVSGGHASGRPVAYIGRFCRRGVADQAAVQSQSRR